MATNVIEAELHRQQLDRAKLNGKVEGYKTALNSATGDAIPIYKSKIKSTEQSIQTIDACIYGLEGSLKAIHDTTRSDNKQQRHVANPFDVVPCYPDPALVTEHPEWRDFYPTTTRFLDTPSKIRPDVHFPRYQRGADVRVFLREWKQVCVVYMLHGFMPDNVYLFSSLATAVIALDWGDSYIVKCENSVPCLLSRLLLSFGGHNVSLESYQTLQALAPNGIVPDVLRVFEDYAPKVLSSEASKATLAALFISKIDDQIGIHLCTKVFTDFQSASEEALLIHNSRIRSRALGTSNMSFSPHNAPSPVMHVPPQPHANSMDWTAVVHDLKDSLVAAFREGQPKGGGGRKGGQGGKGNHGKGSHDAHTPGGTGSKGDGQFDVTKVKCFQCQGWGHFADQCASKHKHSPSDPSN